MYNNFGIPTTGYNNYLQSGSQQATLPYTGQVQYVHGRAGIEAVQMNPNCSGFFADDSEDDVVWVKKTDATGIASIAKGHITFEDETPVESEFVTKSEFDDLKTKVEKVLEELS